MSTSGRRLEGPWHQPLGEGQALLAYFRKGWGRVELLLHQLSQRWYSQQQRFPRASLHLSRRSSRVVRRPLLKKSMHVPQRTLAHNSLLNIGRLRTLADMPRLEMRNYFFRILRLLCHQALCRASRCFMLQKQALCRPSRCSMPQEQILCRPSECSIQMRKHSVGRQSTSASRASIVTADRVLYVLLF